MMADAYSTLIRRAVSHFVTASRQRFASKPEDREFGATLVVQLLACSGSTMWRDAYGIGRRRPQASRALAQVRAAGCRRDFQLAPQHRANADSLKGPVLADGRAQTCCALDKREVAD
jgi:hypothetical protein